MIDINILPALAYIARLLIDLAQYIPAALVITAVIGLCAGGALLIHERDSAGVSRYENHTIAIGYQCGDCIGVMVRLCDNSIYCPKCKAYNAQPKALGRGVICNYCLATRESDCLVPSCCQKVQRKNK